MTRIRERAICVLFVCLLAGSAGRAAGEDSFTIDTQAGRIKSRVYCPSLGKDKADGSTLEIKDVQWVPAAAASKK